MSKPGPSPTPTRKLELRGSWRAKTRPGEPKPEPKAPPRPEGMDARAALVWDAIVPQLEAAGMLACFDAPTFARYCDFSVVWDDMIDFVRKSGHAHPVKNARGEVVGVRSYPQVRNMIQIHELLLRVEREYGMTPAARARMTAEPRELDEPAFDYFSPARFTG